MTTIPPGVKTELIENIKNPEPILLQQKSKLNTNPFIPDTQKQLELQNIQDNANQIMMDYYNKSSTTSIQNLSLSNISKNLSDSIIGLMNDLLNKPKNIDWFPYIEQSIKKDNRYTYIGILFIIIALYFILTQEDK